MMEKYNILQQYIDGNMHRTSIIEATEFGLGFNSDNARLKSVNQETIQNSEREYSLCPLPLSRNRSKVEGLFLQF